MGARKLLYQGQELDNEIKQEGNSVNYKYRMHSLFREYGNPRVEWFLAVVPLAKQYPHNSPYAFSVNIVINTVKLEGLEIIFVGHSQYNAHMLGMALAIRAYEFYFNKFKRKEGEEELHVEINFVMLSVFQGEDNLFAKFIKKLDINAIQYTYENDLLDVDDVVGVPDANSEGTKYDDEGYTTRLKVHSATIDDEHAIEEIIIEDENNHIYEKKR